MKPIVPPLTCILALGIIFAGCSSRSLPAALLSWVAGYAMIRWAAERMKTPTP